MSLKNWLLSFSGLGLVVGAGLSLSSQYRLNQESNRISLKAAKFHPERLQISKPRQEIEIQVEVVGGFPNSNNEPATLRAVVRADQMPKEAVDYQWILPEGVQLTRGSSRGLIQGLDSQQDLNLEIEVLGFSSEGMPRSITFETSSRRGSSIVGASAVLSSHPTRSDLSISFRPTKNELENAEEVRAKTMSLGEETPELKNRAPASKNIHY